MAPQDNWAEYARLVITQLETNTAAIKEIGENHHRLRNEIHSTIAELRINVVKDIADLRRRQEKDLNDRIAKVERDLEIKIDAAAKGFSAKLESVSKEIEMANRNISALQVKAGVWGFGGSFLAVALAWITRILIT